jgi:hypothetical protein
MRAPRWAAALAASWAGALLCIAALAAPAAFATLAPADAGRYMGWVFAVEADLSLVVALLLLFIERRRNRDAAESGLRSVLGAETLLLLGTIFCTVAGYFALQPMMAAARLGQGVLSFAMLHAISGGFYALKLVLVLTLAWRFGRR